MENIQIFLKTLLNNNKKSKTKDLDKSQNLTNPFNEIKLLTSHTDIIRVFEKIDSSTFASASDDGTITIWCSSSGEKIHVLKGHTKPVTCLLNLDGSVLVSGSVDRSLRFWNVESGKCTKFIPNAHESSVKCLTSVGFGKFCSGGNDRYLCLWDHAGNFLGSIERQEEENLHCLLAISENRAITGSNSSLLLVYRTDTLKFCKLFTYHRESVRCLVTINEETFASGSLDGVIVVWDMENLSPLKKLCYPEKFISASSQHKYYAYSVNNLLVLGKRYLAACVGKGFRIYDTQTGECVMERQDAHESTVFNIISMFGGRRFVTCSADAQIKLWGSSEKFDFEFEEEENSPHVRRKRIYYPPVCLGEMWGHTNQVKLLMKVTETSFVSGGEDNLIILWKDGEEQSLLRSLDAAMAFVEDNSQFFENQLQSLANDDQDSSSGLYTASENPFNEVFSDCDEREEEIYYNNDIDYNDKKMDLESDSKLYDEKKRPPIRLQSEIYKISEDSVLDSKKAIPISIKKNNTTKQIEESHTPLIVPTMFSQQVKNVRVPAYIYDYAKSLFIEENLSLETIYEDLKKEGHSDSIVKAVCLKLSQELQISWLKLN